jgi:hypothetical protein
MKLGKLAATILSAVTLFAATGNADLLGPVRERI